LSSQPTAADSAAGKKIPLANLFTGFLMIGLMGFGGIAQSAQYVMVERRKWMNSKEFVELLGVCSILPGGNFLNASVIIGDRNHGVLGSLACLGALLLMPMVILLGIAFAYDTYSYLPDVRAATAGGASAAAGLIFGTSVRLVQGVSRTIASLVAGVATFLVIGILREPLWLVVVLIAPAALLWTLYAGRRA
jgi:chromate transporter